MDGVAINVSTGEQITVPLTPEAEAEMNAFQAEIAALKATNTPTIEQLQAQLAALQAQLAALVNNT